MQLLVTQVNVIVKTSIILDDFESEPPFIIASPQRLKPVTSTLVWLSLVTPPNIISRTVIDGNGIRAPPSQS